MSSEGNSVLESGPGAIVASRVTKVYRSYEKPRDRMLELLYGGHRMFHRKVTALDNVSFSLRSGARIGIVGENGSGKSTLLKMLAGVLSPSSGQVDVRGRVSALLELGAGFNAELSGRENIAQFCLLHGLRDDEMREATPEIVRFSELGDAINHPVKTYSSGMGIRLGFSCAVYVKPDILIVDEALSVGDAYFQNKCLHKIKSLLDGGTTFIYVTHAADSIRSLCEEGLWLNQGKVVMNDTAAKVGRAYQSMVYKRLSSAGLARNQAPTEADADGAAMTATSDGVQEPSTRPTVATETPMNVSEGPLQSLHAGAHAEAGEGLATFASRVAPFRTGSGEIRVVEMLLIGEDGNDTDSIDFERQHLIRVLLQVDGQVPPRTALAVGITDQTGRQLVHINSLDHDIDLHDMHPGAQEVLEFTYHCPLCPGEYGLIAGIATMMENPLLKKQLLNESVVDYCVGGARFAIRYPVEEEGRDLWGLVAVKADVQTYSIS